MVKSGHIRIQVKTPHDYATLNKPWKEHELYGMFSPKLPSRHTVNQTVLILGLNSLVSEQEIQSALKEQNIFPKEKGIH
jgi:hypothetical protein